MGGYERYGEEMRQLSAAVLAVTSHLSVRDVLQTLVTSARQLVGARYAALGVPDDDGSFAEFVVDGITDEQMRDIGPLPRQHGLLGVMLSQPRPVRLTDIRQHPQFGWWPDAHPVLDAFLGMPIVDGDEILGELFLANKRTPGGFTAEDEELLRLLAAHAAIALVNARLYERSRELSIMEERNRIAHELHDAVTQKLFSLRLTAEAAAALVTRDPGRAAAELDTVRGLAAGAIDELKAIVVGLRPIDLGGDGLGAALRRQAELLDRVHPATVTFTSEPDPAPRLTQAREEAAYRIAQEALHNALRHGTPTEVRIVLRAANGALRLEITDDGPGFEPDTQAESTRRLGLASMRDRARTVGGRFEVSSRPGAGTSVRLEVPTGG